MLRVPQRHRRSDGQTDGRTTYDSNTALALCASRGINNEGQSNLALSGITANWVSRPPNLPSHGGPGSLLGNHTSVPAKWHLIPSSGFSKVHECDDDMDECRRTDHTTCVAISFSDVA